MLGLDRPGIILILGLGLCCLALIGFIILLYIRYSVARDRLQDGVDTLRRAYFEVKDALDQTILSGHPFRHSAAEFNNSLTRHFDIRKLAIYISSRGRFVPIIWHNIDLPGINKLYFPASSELVRKLNRDSRPIWFDIDEPHDNLSRLMHEKIQMKVAFPMSLGKQLYGMVMVSESNSYRLDDIADYIFSLTDQLSYAFELSKKGHTAGKTAGGLKIPAYPDHYNISEDRTGYISLLEDNVHLLKIYNENQLMNTFMGMIEKNFNPAFAFVCLPHGRKVDYKIAYNTSGIPAHIKDFEVKGGDPLINILSREHGVHRMQHIEEALGADPAVRMLSEAGCKVISSFPLPRREMGFLGLGEKASAGVEYSPDELNIIGTFCQTLRLTVDNIFQFKKIEELSYTDSMTGLYNYRYFYKRLGEEILRAKRFERFMALVIFDIDEFKIINDSHGHQTGDHILKQLGMLIHNSVRLIDIVSRYGGEEFCVIMPETDRDACEQFMERLRMRISQFDFRDRSGRKKLNISVSLGGAIYPTDATRIDRLIYCADMALLESKKSGRNKVSLYKAQREGAS
jgi:diguanylate cyclase (GGDEF)-like protein